jgi:hypothetical protein
MDQTKMYIFLVYYNNGCKLNTMLVNEKKKRKIFRTSD